MMIYNTENSPFKDLESTPFSEKSWLNFWYPKICEFLHLSPEEDLLALESSLTKLSSNFSLNNLVNLLESKRVIAIAPGIHLEKEIDEYLQREKKSRDVLVSADGATSYLLSRDIIPHIIVSDLDGNASDQLEAQKKGSVILLHIHGDNYKKIEPFFKEISARNFLITTQIHPLPNSFNFFGFTDGDRIVCLSTYMKTAEIVLIGYDFGSEIGKFSKNGSLDERFKERKMKKFVIGKSIINWCSNQGQKISLFSNLDI